MAWDSPQCPIVVGDAAGGLVFAGYDTYSAFAKQAWSIAINDLSALGAQDLQTINPNVTFNFDTGLFTFIRPQEPTLPDIDYRDQGDVPDAPALMAPSVVFTDPPVEPTGTVPTIEDYQEPSATLDGMPAPLGALEATAFDPGSFAMTALAAPALELPDIPPPDLVPPFTDITPTPTPGIPGSSFAFTPTEYADSLLDAIKSRIAGVMDGDTLLPTAVVQAMRDRANAAIDTEEQRASEEVFDDFAARNFETPPGMLMRRLEQVRQNGQNERGKANRDIFTQEQTAAREDVRFAITQGVALESALIGAHNDAMRIGMEAARLTQDLDIQLFGARVGFYNAQMQANAIEANIQRDRAQTAIDAASLKLQAQRARGEITERQYVDRMHALELEAEQFRVNLAAAQAAAQAKGEDNRTTLESYRATLAGHAEERAGFEAEWANWTRKWDTNNIKMRSAEIASNVYSSRVQAWSTEQHARIDQAQLGIAVNDQLLRGWQGKVSTVMAKYGAERDRVQTLATIAQSKVALYQANVAVETAASDANLRILMAGLQAETARVNVALKNADLAIQQLIENNKLREANQEAIARLGAQLAASSMSAVNFSAGISSNLSQGYGCHTSFTYSGAIDN